MSKAKIYDVTATGSTTPRDIRDRFADIINVKDFGAVGNGVTDDTAAFEAAAKAGRTVFVPEGQYKLSRKVAGTFISAGGASSSGKFVSIDQIGLSLREIQNRVTNRLANNSVHAFDLFQSDGSNNWGEQGLQDVMRDPHSGLVYANFGWKAEGTEKYGANQMHVFQWDPVLKGYKAIASSEKLKLVFSHQGVSLYRPKPSDRVRFFCGTYGVDGYWHVLRLVEWDYTTTTPPTVVRKWTLFDEDKFHTTNDYGNCRLNVTLSPDMRKLAARGLRIDDGVYVYRVWDVEELLALPPSGENTDDASLLYEASVDNPWGTEEVDLQSLAFDGATFYGLYSAGGYSPHKIKAWNLNGEKVLERPYAMEGIHENPTQRQFEGESLSFLQDAYTGTYDLYLGVSVADEKWTTLRQACVYNLTAAGADKYSLLNGMLDVITDVDTTTAPGLWGGEQEAFDGLLDGRGYLQVLANRDRSVGGIVQIVQHMTKPAERYLRTGTFSTGDTVVWSAWQKIMAADATGNLQASTLALPNPKNATAVLSASYYGVERVNIKTTSGYAELTDNTKNLRFNAGAGTESPTIVMLTNTASNGEQHIMHPMTTKQVSLGRASGLWTQVFAATGSINTSDAREKVNLSDPNEPLMRAWGKVNFKAFQFTDAVEKKGEDARIHFGVIAQQVMEAFASEGLDASRYALFCHDAWEDEYEEQEDGTKVLITPAGDRYGIRYSEALALECAYQRWRLDQLEKKMNG